MDKHIDIGRNNVRLTGGFWKKWRENAVGKEYLDLIGKGE